MGTNTIPSATSGSVIPNTDHNSLVQALLEDFVPRNANRSPEDVAGQLGSSIYRWLRAYIKEYYIGTAGNNLKIYEGANGEIWIERANAEILKFRDGQVDLIGPAGDTIAQFNTITGKGLTFNSLAAKGNKVKVGDWHTTVPVGVNNYATNGSASLTDCKAGKKILISFCAEVVEDNTGGGTCDFRVQINGTIVKTWTDSGRLATSGTVNAYNKAYEWNIPSDGNYTVNIQSSEYLENRGNYRIEEI